jgi:hypothetical protein
MEMDKKSGPERTSVKDTKNSNSSQVKADSRKAGNRSENSGYYIDELGRVCYGNECLKVTMDDERKEIVLNIKPGAKCNIDPFVKQIQETLGKGARTVYEVESEVRET